MNKYVQQYLYVKRRLNACGSVLEKHVHQWIEIRSETESERERQKKNYLGGGGQRVKEKEDGDVGGCGGEVVGGGGSEG